MDTLTGTGLMRCGVCGAGPGETIFVPDLQTPGQYVCVLCGATKEQSNAAMARRAQAEASFPAATWEDLPRYTGGMPPPVEGPCPECGFTERYRDPADPNYVICPICAAAPPEYRRGARVYAPRTDAQGAVTFDEVKVGDWLVQLRQPYGRYQVHEKNETTRTLSLITGPRAFNTWPMTADQFHKEIFRRSFDPYAPRTDANPRGQGIDPKWKAYFSTPEEQERIRKQTERLKWMGEWAREQGQQGRRVTMGEAYKAWREAHPTDANPLALLGTAASWARGDLPGVIMGLAGLSDSRGDNVTDPKIQGMIDAGYIVERQGDRWVASGWYTEGAGGGLRDVERMHIFNQADAVKFASEARQMGFEDAWPYKVPNATAGDGTPAYMVEWGGPGGQPSALRQAMSESWAGTDWRGTPSGPWLSDARMNCPTCGMFMEQVKPGLYYCDPCAVKNMPEFHCGCGGEVQRRYYEGGRESMLTCQSCGRNFEDNVFEPRSDAGGKPGATCIQCKGTGKQAGEVWCLHCQGYGTCGCPECLAASPDPWASDAGGIRTGGSGCPKCGSTDVHQPNVQAGDPTWVCKKCYYGWKPGATEGPASTGMEKAYRQYMGRSTRYSDANPANAGREYAAHRGYTHRLPGGARRINASELARHTGMAGKTVREIMVRPEEADRPRYGVVIATDGTFVDGALHLFSDAVSVS